MIEKQNVKAIAANQCRTRKEISLSGKKNENYDNDTKNKIDLNQTNDKCLIITWRGNSQKRSYEQLKYFIYLFIIHLFIKL